MKQTGKKLQALLLAGVLVFNFSAPAFASEAKGEAKEVTGQELTINWTDNEDYAVVLVDEEEVYTYTGEAVEPQVKVVCKQGETGETSIEVPNENEQVYQVSYENNVNVGTATVKVTALENSGYQGELSTEFEIQAADLSDANVTLSATEYTYNGNAKTPSVTVELNGKVLEKETDYTVEYVDHTAVGTAKAVVKGVGNYCGETSAEYKILFKTPVLSTSTEYNKVNLTWTKVPGVDGYEVLRSKSKGSGYAVIATLSSADAKSYADKKVEFNKTYYYKVRGYQGTGDAKVYTKESSVCSQRVRPAQVNFTKLSRVRYNEIKLTWEKVSGASGYAVYRSSSKNGEYKIIAKVKKGSELSYTDKDLTCGKKFYYKVKAYRTVGETNYYGSESKIRYNYTRPAKTKFSDTQTTYKSTKITLNWTKTAGAEGYEVYRATSKNGTYKKVKTLSGKSTTSWTNTGLSKSKTYYYKVRAYCKIDGKTFYGSYSDVLKKSKAGWRYVNGYKLYYDASGNLVKDVSNIIGKQSSYVIKVNKQQNCVTVYAKDGSNGYIIPVKAMICSTGYSTPTGTFYTPAKYRWHTLMGPSYGQWCTRIYKSFLFHSVFYNGYNNNNALSVSAYNKLGITASHGCVRLTAGDAKWIYDNCKLSTKVIIYNSSTSGPLGKPSAYKLPYWHTWDPTDPNMKSKCKSRGCH